MTTKEKILEAATEVFIQKGLSGARMQEIADKATALGVQHHLMPEAGKKVRIYFVSLSDAIKVLVTKDIKLLSGK
jgi:hypothetical protein